MVAKNKERNLKKLFKRYKDSAKKRGHRWKLTVTQFTFMTQGLCYYCGTPPLQMQGGGKNAYLYNGLDRVNNDVGYLPDNVVPCCGRCNKAKNISTRENFTAWLDRLIRNRLSGQSIQTDSTTLTEPSKKK